MNTIHRAIVVTGVTRGLGRALAEYFLKAGHTVCGCGRSESAIAELAAAFGKPHRFDAVNVASDRAVAQWARRVLNEIGSPDLLINNAAVIAPPALLWEVPARAFDLCVDVNIKGVANVIRHFVPAMVRRRSGIVVNISSGWGRSVSPKVAPYCATKWAIEGLTKALAEELPNGMAAVAVNPGIIDTDMLQSCFGEEAGNYPSPQQWVEKAGPFFLSLTADHNGQSLTVR
jgi:NAD(P)-dependent dehydrogenase (short-subunit alcohol dehydrogenase family)